MKKLRFTFAERDDDIEVMESDSESGTTEEEEKPVDFSEDEGTVISINASDGHGNEVDGTAIFADEGHSAQNIDLSEFESMGESEGDNSNGDEDVLILPPEPEMADIMDPLSEELGEAVDTVDTEPVPSDKDVTESEPPLDFKNETAAVDEPKFRMAEEMADSGPEPETAVSDFGLDDELASEFDEPLILPDEDTAYDKSGELSHDTEAEQNNSVTKAFPKKVAIKNFQNISFSFNALFESNILLGLDIGTRSIKYVMLKKGARSYALLNCGMQIIPDNTDLGAEEIRVLIADILNNKNIRKHLKHASITTVVSGLQVTYQTIQIAKTARNELDRAVPWACRKDMPFPVESAILEHRVIPDGNEKLRDKLDVFVVAAQNELISYHLEMLEKARIQPTKISTVPVALWALTKLMLKQERYDNFAVVDIGANASHIVFVSQGQLQFAREVTTAGEDFTSSLTGDIFFGNKELHLKRDQAERIKRGYGFPKEMHQGQTEEGLPLKEIRVMLRPILERLVNELQRTIDFYKEKSGGQKIEAIFLTGGSSLLKNLEVKLSQELKLPVEIINPFKKIAVNKRFDAFELDQIGARFAVAVGLALDRDSALNLLPKPLKTARLFAYLSRSLRYLLVIVFLLLIFLSEEISTQVQKVEKQLRVTKTEFMQAQPKRERFVALQKQLAEIENKNAQYKNKIAVNLSLAEYLKLLSHLVPPKIVLTSVRVERRAIKQDETKEKKAKEKAETVIQKILILEGVALRDDSMEGVHLADFLLDLEKSSYFVGIALRSQKIREDGGLAFMLECQL